MTSKKNGALCISTATAYEENVLAIYPLRKLDAPCSCGYVNKNNTIIVGAENTQNVQTICAPLLICTNVTLFWPHTPPIRGPKVGHPPFLPFCNVLLVQLTAKAVLNGLILPGGTDAGKARRYPGAAFTRLTTSHKPLL